MRDRYAVVFKYTCSQEKSSILKAGAKSMTRKVLLITSCRWFSVARLATAFRRSGCAVEVVCPGNHPVLATRELQGNYRYLGIAPLRSVRTAILASRPDILVPCDDLSMRHLHRLYEAAINTSDETAAFLCNLIQLSLGDPSGYSITESREKLMEIVRQAGIQTPEAKNVSSVEEVKDWLAWRGLPAVLKADGTSGGEGVRIVHTKGEAARAYRTLRRPLSAPIVAKRALLDGDWTSVPPWLQQQQRSVSIQAFVDGPDANVAAACWEGEVLSSISVEVVETWRPKGPATIIRCIHKDEMAESVTRIVKALGFSGLCGFDFLIDRTTGQPILLEMNARATQTCPLTLGQDRDPVAFLSARVTGQLQRREPLEVPGDTIALFPLAWQGDTTSKTFLSAYHDIPWDEPELIRLGMAQVKDTRRKRWIERLKQSRLYQA